MLRCTTCGIRLAPGHPHCPRHDASCAVASTVAQGSADPLAASDHASDHASNQESGTRLIAPAIAGFVVEELLGQGGFGAVWLAQYHGEPCALKVAATNEMAQTQLHHEAEVLRLLAGQHAPKYLLAALNGPPPHYLAMQKIDAPTLAQVMEMQAGPFPVTNVCTLALQLVEALAPMHQLGFVHRDIKPENFFVTPTEILVFDFGLTKRVGTRAGGDDADKWAGTAEYMAPEQCDGEATSRVTSDIYSLGIIFYELATGRPPFWGTEAEIKEAHRSRRPPLISKTLEFDADLAHVIHRCLAKAQDRRFENLSALHRALSAIREHAGDPTRSQTPRESSNRGDTSTHDQAVELTASGNKLPPAQASTSKPARDRQTVGLLWFESNAPIAALQNLIAEVSGQLAATAQHRHIIVFSHDTGDNPVRSALQTARTLTSRNMAQRVLVDVATVSLRTRPDGSRQYMSPIFNKRERFLTTGDPLGIFVSDTACELIPETPIAPCAKPGMVEVLGFGEASQVTIVRPSTAPFFGHASLVDTLVRSAAQAANGRPTLITVLGAPGFGKSALASHLSHAIANSSASLDIEALRALEPIGLGVHRTLDELARRILALPERCPADQAFALCSERLGEAFAQEVRLGLSVALGWLSPDAPELRSLSAAPGALRAAAAFAVGKVLRRLASKHALAIILDDAHFVDETLLDALEYAALAEGSAPLWVCLLARPSFREHRPNFGERATKKLMIDLPALTGIDAHGFARSLLQPVHTVPDRALALLVERTQGVPLLLVELVRGLRRDGIIRPSERGSGWILATDELERLPALPAVQWLAANEVAALPPQLAALARLAAVQGPHFNADELDTLVGELEVLGIGIDTDLDVSVGLARLATAGVITSDRRQSYRFRHELLRGILYESVDETLRSAVHRAAYVLTERRQELSREDRLQRLAFHAGRAGLRDQAAEAYLALGRELQSRHAYVEGETCYAQSLQNLSEDDPRRMDATWRLGTMQFRVGRNDDALKQLERALDLARKRQDQRSEIGLLLDAATVLDWLDDYTRSATLVAQAQSCAQDLDDPLIRARIDLGLGRSSLRHNNPEHARELTWRAAQEAKVLGDDGYETYVIALLLAGAALGMLGQIDASREICDQAMAAALAHGDNLHLGSALQNRVFVWIMQNNLEALLDDMRRVIEIARESGAAMLEGRSLYNLGEITYLVGDFRAAERHARRSIEVHHSLVGPGNRTLVSQLLLARVQLSTYDTKSAKATLHELRTTQAKARELGRADAELVSSDALLLEVVDLALTPERSAQWPSYLERAKTESVQQEQIEVIELAGIAAYLRGELELAHDYFAQALAVAQTIPNIMESRLRARTADLQQRSVG